MNSKHQEERIQAFESARELVSVARAAEILRWKNWRHGGVLGGAPEPTCPDISEAENQVVKRLWLTLDGSSCWMSALYMLCNDERPDSN